MYKIGNYYTLNNGALFYLIGFRDSNVVYGFYMSNKTSPGFEYETSIGNILSDK